MKRTSSLLIDESPLMVLPALAAEIGLNEAIFLQQVHFWLKTASGRSIRGRKWIYNSVAEWQKQFPFWCPRTISTIIANLRGARGGTVLLIAANHNAAKFDKTLWYTIDYEALEAVKEAIALRAEVEAERAREEDACELDLLPSSPEKSASAYDDSDVSIMQDLHNENANIAGCYSANVAAPIPEKRSHTEITNTCARSFPQKRARSDVKKTKTENSDPVYAAFHTRFFALWDTEYKKTTQGERYRFNGGYEGGVLKRSKLHLEPWYAVEASVVAFLRVGAREDKYLANNRTIKMFLGSWNHAILANARVNARKQSHANPDNPEELKRALAADEAKRQKQKAELFAQAARQSAHASPGG